MPKERKDTTPKSQEEDSKLSPAGLGVGGAGTGISETQQDSTDELYNPLSDPDLWKPHPPTEDCPVCFVPLPLEAPQCIFNACCGNLICVACRQENDRALKITNRKREKKDLPPLDRSCAFCREPVYKNDSELIERYEKRVAKGDIEAMFAEAFRFLDGLIGTAKDEAKGVELLKKAAHMGLAKAMHQLGTCYITGSRGFPQDVKKGIMHLQDAVKMGDISSRCYLAKLFIYGEEEFGFHLANKHLRLAAEAGDKIAVKQIWELYSSGGKLSKADLEEILRAHQSACDEMDSEDRRRNDAYEKALDSTDVILRDLHIMYYDGFMNAKQLKEVLKMHQKGCGVEKICGFLKKIGII